MTSEYERAAELVAMMEDEYNAGTLSDYDMSFYVPARVLLEMPVALALEIKKPRKPLFGRKDAQDVFAITAFMSGTICGLVICVTASYFLLYMLFGLFNILTM